MIAEKKIKPGDAYLTGNQIVAKLGISKGAVYKLYNQGRVRYIFKKIPRCGELCDLIHFNLDDICENLKKNGHDE